jgi:hypothetical protein
LEVVLPEGVVALVAGDEFCCRHQPRAARHYLGGPLMPRKKVAPPVPPYLEELMLLLEAQSKPAREEAIRTVEANHEGLVIDLDAELAEHEAFATRYWRWWGRITRGLEDAQVNRALDGKGSAAAALREIRALGAPASRGNGRSRGGPMVLEKHHEANVERYRKGW